MRGAGLHYNHSAIQQFTGASVDLHTIQTIDSNSYSAFAPHLDGLWRYGLRQFKLLARPGYFEPIRTLIRDDVRIDLHVDPLLSKTDYKRSYKTSRGLLGQECGTVPGKLRKPAGTGASGR